MDNDPNDMEAGADPAARAFAELAAKIALLEAAVAGLAAKRDAAPDYSETLADMAALLERMRDAINDMACSPAMELTPEAMAERITAAGATSRSSDSAVIERAGERRPVRGNAALVDPSRRIPARAAAKLAYAREYGAPYHR